MSRYRDSSPGGPSDELNASFSPPNRGSRSNRSSFESTSTTSLILERINPDEAPRRPYDPPAGSSQTKEAYDDDEDEYSDIDPDVELGSSRGRNLIQKPMEKKVRRIVYIIGAVLVGGWLLALAIYVSTGSYKAVDTPHDPAATSTVKPGKRLHLDQILQGRWRAQSKPVKWVDGEKDGLMLVSGGYKGFVEVQDVNDREYSKILMKKKEIPVDGRPVAVTKYWPSPDLNQLLLATDVESVSPSFNATEVCANP